MEWYRSGHNELHWNCSSRETGPWVRIPLTPPEIAIFKSFRKWLFFIFLVKNALLVQNLSKEVIVFSIK